MTFLILSLGAWAEDSSQNSEQKFVEMRKTCVAQKKPKAMCHCVVKILDDKFRNGQFTNQQVSDALTVMRNIKPTGDEASRVDAMADLTTGLEFHCMENPNYSGE